MHIAGPAGNIDAQERAAAANAAAKKKGLELITIEGDFEEESGAAAVDSLRKSSTRFDAIFAANDNMAIGALEALRRAGVHVPEDVAVAGFDDIPLARHLGVTTVRVRIAELGERALTRLLDELAKGHSGGDELHAPVLVVRSTSQLETTR